MSGLERDSMKLIYARMMFAAAPMFEKLTPQEQGTLVHKVANDLMQKIQSKADCERDAHILVIPDEENKKELDGSTE